MPKYSAKGVDMEKENNSLTKLINLTPKNSQVLDFVCASGYLGEYLIKEKDCEVTGLEYDRADAQKSEKRGYQKVIVCDLDNDKWEDELENHKYDVAIFADILEHLKYPEQVLEKTKKLLKKEGKILVSIPNIAHLSVRLELLNGSFEYEEMGILDNTYLKYWTRDSFWRLLNGISLYVEHLDWVREEIPEEILTAYKNKINTEDLTEEALAYQWIWQVSTARKDEKITASSKPFKPLKKTQALFTQKNEKIRASEVEIIKEQAYIKKLEKD